MGNLERILEELHSISSNPKSKDEIMLEAVNERISKSIESYYKELTDSFTFLAKKDSAKVLKNI